MNVVKFPTEADMEKESAIKCLEGALQSAKEGRIQSLALAVVRPDGSIASLWSEGTPSSLLGALAFTQHRLCVDAMAPDSDDI